MENVKTISVEDNNVRLDRYIRRIFPNLKQSVIEKSLRRELIKVDGYNLQPGHLSSLPAPNFQPTATQEPDGPCGNQHYSREIVMMGIAVSETC